MSIGPQPKTPLRLAAAAALLLLVACPTGPAGEDPSIEVELPDPAAEYRSDTPVQARARVADLETATTDLRVSWRRDGEALVTGLVPDGDGVVTTNLELPEGLHRVEAVVVDTDGQEASDSVEIEVLAPNTAPTCAIENPAPGSTFAVGTPFNAEASISDAEQQGFELRCHWELRPGNEYPEQAVTSAGRCPMQLPGLARGLYTLELHVVDPEGLRCTASVEIAARHPPTAQITAPPAGALVIQGVNADFVGQVNDTEDPGELLTVTWSSTVDGVLAGPMAAGPGGITTALDAVLSSGDHTIVLRVTDTDGLTGSAQLNIDYDAAPSVPRVVITPLEPDTDATLLANVQPPSVDPEGQPVTYRTKWFRDGLYLPALDDRVAVGSWETQRAQEWRVEVRATDGRAISDPGEATVTIFNNPPTVLPPWITPDPAYASEDLTCNIGPGEDVEGDSVSVAVYWTVEGADVGAGLLTLPSSFTTRGDAVTCTTVPWDGFDWGTPQTSPPVVVANALPTTPVVGITPATAGANDALTCSVTTPSTDQDGDPITYDTLWLQNGAATAHTAALLPASATQAGDVWTCEVTPFDGLDDGIAGFTHRAVAFTPLLDEFDVGGHDSTFVGNVRGYWFEAPTEMTITALRVPVDVVGAQHLQVVRFGGGAPPAFPTTTGDFETLHHSTGTAGAGWVAVEIPLMTGDVVGVLGQRGDETSYRATGAWTTDVDGSTVALTRLVFQGAIGTNPATALSSGATATGSIGRVELEFTVP